MIILLYDNGELSEVLIPDDGRELWQYAIEGQIKEIK
jgi:hypothetical protein